MSSSTNPYLKMPPKEVLEKFSVDSKKGLSHAEAQKRLEEYGVNALEEKKESHLKKFLSFFWGPIPFMIEIAAILSAVLEKWPDLIIILLMLFINAGLGFFQEFKAGNAIAALKKKLALHARALRDGVWQDVEAKNLVPGDIIIIKLGNIIPADVKLISGEYLSVDQSTLTGESLPVEKKEGDIAYSGTIAKLGEMVAVVTETGMKTFFGRTAKLVSSAKTTSHLQEAIIKIGNFLIFSTLGICAIILGVSLFRIETHQVLHESIGQIIIFILVLVVAGIPIALPAVLSATMAIGASRLAQLKAIVSKLTAIEELASMDILCSDKTGTLTKNELSIGQIKIFQAKDEKEVMDAAYLSSQSDSKDPIDEAIIRYFKGNIPEGFSKEKFLPFDPVKKRTEATIKSSNGKTQIYSKGAPQVILELSDSSKDLTNSVNDSIEEFAKKGYRTLGVAKKDEKGKWQFLGLIPLFDPPRDDTKETLDRIQHLGVEVKMVTGDHTAIAKELSDNLGLGNNILSVREMYEKNNALDRNRDHTIEKADGFAEVFPEHKFEIVKTLQHLNHVTGMTGDGVNDAPALKQANIGIAVSGASDAAKEAADLVLTEPGLMVICRAIEEARRIFGRMKSYAMYRISETCRLLLFLFLSMILFNEHLLSAAMIILIALLNDVPIMMIAYDHMRTHTNPVTWNMKEILTVAIGLAIAGVVSTFGLVWIGDQWWFSNITDASQHFALLRTLSFMGILCGGNLTIYLTRNIGPIWQKPYPEWKFFAATLFSLVAGTLLSVYGIGTNDFVGIGWKYVGLSWIYIFVWFIICMLVKEGIYRTIGYKETYLDEFIHETGEKIHP